MRDNTSGNHPPISAVILKSNHLVRPRHDNCPLLGFYKMADISYSVTSGRSLSYSCIGGWVGQPCRVPDDFKSLAWVGSPPNIQLELGCVQLQIQYWMFYLQLYTNRQYVRNYFLARFTMIICLLLIFTFFPGFAQSVRQHDSCKFF